MIAGAHFQLLSQVVLFYTALKTQKLKQKISLHTLKTGTSYKMMELGPSSKVLQRPITSVLFLSDYYSRK